MIELTRMELENFRPFSENDIDIGYSKKKLVIFEGNTGEGKTALAESIRWCLFGIHSSTQPMQILKEIKTSDSRITNDYDTERLDFDLFNKDALAKSKLNKPITCRVTLTFELDNEGVRDKIVFSRSMQLIRKKELPRTKTGVIDIRLDEFEFVKDFGKYQNVQVLKWDGSRQVPIEGSTIKFVETYFPLIVNDYYIVFGEQFVDPHNPEKIRLAIEQNCFSNVFDKIKDNLENLKTDIVKDGLKDNRKREKLDELQSDKNDIIILIKQKKEELETQRTNKLRLEDAISSKDKEIGESGSEQAKLLKERRGELEIELRTLNKDISEVEKEIISDGFNTLIRVLTHDADQELIEELEKNVEKGDIPPKIKSEFINSLIEKGKCICKRDITAKEKKFLEELRDKNIVGENYKEFLDLIYKLKANKEELADKVDYYLKRLKEVEGKKENKRSDEEQLNKISKQLDSLKNVDKLEEERRKYVSLRDKIDIDMTLLSDRIRDLESRRSAFQKDIDRIGINNITNKKDSKTEICIDKIIVQIQKTKEDIIDSTRNEIEKFASDIYKKLFRNAAEVERVELDKNYQVRVVLKKNGEEYIKSNFSTGEGLVFAISFLTALRKYSGYTGPIFLDSPYSVLDPDHRTRVSLNLPQAIPGQLIIFTRPDTFEDIKKEMMPYINQLIKVTKESEWHSKISVIK